MARWFGNWVMDKRILDALMEDAIGYIGDVWAEFSTSLRKE